MTIDELISELEKANGPSIALDHQIAELTMDRSRAVFMTGDSGGIISLKRYTRSIDAALTLVPDGWTVHTIHHGLKQWDVSLCIVGDCGLASADAESNSLAIAICIAALKARKS